MPDLPEDVYFQGASIDDQTEPEPKPKQKRNNTTQVCESTFTCMTLYSDAVQWHKFTLKSKLLKWLSFWDISLDEILCHDGLGDYLDQPRCCICNIGPSLFKCKDCFGGGRLRCQGCVVKVHQDTPLHRIEVNYPVNRRMSRLIQFDIVAMDRLIFQQRFPQKSWSPHTTWTWRRSLPVSVPRAPRIHGFWYLRSPCCECRLLWLP